jgi:hypothetical protein
MGGLGLCGTPPSLLLATGRLPPSQPCPVLATASDPRQRGPCVTPSRFLTRRGREDVEEKPSPSVFTLLGMGVSIALCIAVGLVLGFWLDDVSHLSPLFTFVGLLLGIVLAVATAYAQIKKFL